MCYYIYSVLWDVSTHGVVNDEYPDMLENNSMLCFDKFHVNITIEKWYKNVLAISTQH